MRPVDEAPVVAPGPIRVRAARGCEGFFRVAQDDAGRWWLYDPEGAPCFLRGVHGVDVTGVQDAAGVTLNAAARLRGWGFNALGLDGAAGLREDGLPFLASAQLSAAGSLLLAPGMRLPDVFDPDWAQRAAAHARECCTRLADARALVGWVTDAALDWAPPSAAGRPSLLQLCLSLEPSHAAYHSAWEFVLALHGGRLDRVSQAWNASLANKEVVRELTRAEEGLGTRGYLRDDARWTREFARRYFSTAAAAVREADPHHLVLGCASARPAGAAVAAECVYPSIDVSLPHWTELPNDTAHPSQPLLADNVSWGPADFTRLAAGRRTRRLTTFEHMLRKGRAALDRLARHSAVVGYLWAQWRDEPAEQPPFAGGLVHENGREAREHTELLAQFNSRAENLHGAARR